MKKIGCVLSYDIDRYKEIAECAYKSFKKWNPEVETHLLTPNNIDSYNFQFERTDNPGINKFMRLREIMFQNNYDKIISLDTDTITFSRLDEFLDNNHDDILTSLNYYIHESTEHWSTPIIQVPNVDGIIETEHLNINAGVCCFNSLEALESVITLSLEHLTHFSEQGGLNEMAFVNKQYSVKIVDAPYPTSDVVYNIRGKGVPRAQMIKGGKIVNCFPNNIHGFEPNWLQERNLIDGENSPIKSWYVKGDKLFTHDNKQIKCFHYAEGLGCQTIEKFNELLDDFKTWFNDDTIKFLNEKCDCSNFFKK